MKKTIFTLLACLALTACISEQEQLEATNQYRQLMQNQCANILGFRAGSEGYMECQMFYEGLFDYEGMTGTMSFSRVSSIRNRVNRTTNDCRRYWGADQMDKSALWACIHRTEQERIDEIIHQREMREQEEILRRTIEAAEEEKELNRRIEKERMRVAHEKHKRPEDVRCKTKNKHGHVKVYCS